jgi:hypothetical protein
MRVVLHNVDGKNVAYFWLLSTFVYFFPSTCSSTRRAGFIKNHKI